MDENMSYALPGNFAYIGQVTKDWGKAPFIDMKVETDGCQEGWEPVFSKEWAGMEYTCILWESKGRSKSCKQSVSAAPSITMARLGEVSICGKRGGKPFTVAMRPNSDGVCPDETDACSESTTPENTICISLEEK